jgi:hypothetical protein
MIRDIPTSVNRDALLESLAAKLTLAAYRVALRTRTEGTWLDLELDLWRALADTAKSWGEGKEFAEPRMSFEMLQQEVDGDTAYIVWKAETADNRFELGTDTFLASGKKPQRTRLDDGRVVSTQGLSGGDAQCQPSSTIRGFCNGSIM